MQFTATGSGTGNGSIINLTSSAKWASSAPGIATIDATGLATGLTVGTTTITATTTGYSGSILGRTLIGSTTLTVTAGALAEPIVLVAVTPASPTASAANQTTQFTATATTSSGIPVNLTNQSQTVNGSVIQPAVWSSTSAAVATINPATGLATAVGNGTTTISAVAKNPDGTLVTGSATFTVTLAVSGATEIYVSQQDPTDRVNSVLGFPTGPSTSGTVSANFTAVPPPSNPYPTLAIDPSGELYVGMYLPFIDGYDGPSEVQVYPATKNGTASPIRTITGSSASFYDAGPIVVDSASQLYVLDPTGSISVFSSNANDPATPVRQVTGPHTQLSDSTQSTQPTAIAVDASGNIYVSLASFLTSISSSTWTVLEFSSTADGDVAPERVIVATNPTALFISPAESYPYALDSEGNFYVVSIDPSQPFTSTITEFSSKGTSVAAPVRTLTGFGSVLSLSVDSALNLYVLNSDPSGISVEAFGPSAHGNAAPAIRFTPANITSIVAQIAVR